MMMLDHQRGFQDEIRFITLEAQVDTRTRLRVLVRCFVFEFCMLLYFFCVVHWPKIPLLPRTYSMKIQEI